MRIYNQHFDIKQIKLHFVLKVGSRPKYWIKLGVWKIIIYDLDIKFINKQEARSIVSLIKKLKSLGNLDISFEGHAVIAMLYVIVDLDIYIFPLSLISTLNLWCSDITGIWVWGQLAQLIMQSNSDKDQFGICVVCPILSFLSFWMDIVLYISTWANHSWAGHKTKKNHCLNLFLLVKLTQEIKNCLTPWTSKLLTFFRFNRHAQNTMLTCTLKKP